MLQHLPPEIVLEVLRKLDPVSDRRDLLSLCYVSHAFRELAQRLLFSKFDVGIETGSSGPDTNDFAALALFTRTVSSRHDLQNAVHELSVRSWDAPQLARNTLSAETLEILQIGILKLGVEDDVKARYRKNLLYGDINVLLKMLFGKLNRLEALSVSFREESLIDFVGKFDSEMAGSYLSNLTSIDLELIHTYRSVYRVNIRLKKILPLLCLPNLQHFKMGYCVGDHTDISDLYPKSINASSISLIHSCLDKEAMSSIIKACKCLKTLTYGADLHIAQYVDTTPVIAAELSKALLCQKDNLNGLYLEFDEPNGLGGGDWDSQAALDPITSFTSLTHLKIDQRSLSSTPKLPESLQVLQVSHCLWSVFELVRFLVKESITHLHHLNSVTISTWRLPCCEMLGMIPLWHDITEEEFYSNESVVAEFKERALELSRTAREGSFHFLARCKYYNKCISEQFSADESSSLGG